MQRGRSNNVPDGDVRESVPADFDPPEDNGDFIIFGTIYGGKDDSTPANSLATQLATGQWQSAMLALREGDHTRPGTPSASSTDQVPASFETGHSHRSELAASDKLPAQEVGERLRCAGTDGPITSAAEALDVVQRFSQLLTQLAPVASQTAHHATPHPPSDLPHATGDTSRLTGSDVASLSNQEGRPLESPVHLSPILAAEGGVASQLLQLLMRVSNQAEGYAALVASMMNEMGSAPGHAKNCLYFLTDHLKVPYWQARRLCELGDGLRNHLPQTAHDLCTGKITMQNAQDIFQAMTASQDRIDYLANVVSTDNDSNGTTDISDGPEISGSDAGTADTAHIADDAADAGNAEGHAVFGPVLTGEKALLDRAIGSNPKTFRTIVQGLAQRVDPKASARDYTNLHASQRLEVLADHKGGYLIRGLLDDEAGLTLKTVLNALRVQLPQETRRTTSPEHQNALALHMLARLDLEQVLTTTKNGAQLHLMVNVDHDTFTRALTTAGVPAEQLPSDSELDPARWVDTRGPLADSLLERLACDSKVSRVIFGPASQVLNAGEEVRIASAHQRRAIMARDLHCVFPECTAPPGICEVHHLDEWAQDGGPTNIENLALLCWSHHHRIHDQHLKLTRNVERQWQVLRRDNDGRYPNRC